MKRLAVITTSLLFAFSSLSGAHIAFAEEGEKPQTHYPEDFNKTLYFTDLKNYDIDGNTFYFLNGETYYRYEKDGEGASGELKEFKPDEDFSFSDTKQEVTTEKYYYYFDDNGALTVYEKSTKLPRTFEGEYTSLKEVGGNAYAVKENVLYRFESAEEPSAVQPVYVDYSETEKIAVGQAAENLKNYQALTFVKVRAGAFMTAIDLTLLGGECFELDFSKQKAIDKANNTDVKNKVYPASDATVKAEKDTPALLLCYAGNAAIVSLGDTADGTAYILFNDPSTIEVLPESVVESCKEEAEFETATIIGSEIYASPFTVLGTTLKSDAAGTNVTVNCKIVCGGEYEGLLNSAYYEVVYRNEDGEDVTGYVAAGFLTKYIIEDNKDPSTVPDPEHNEGTRVATVLLILAVVVLVLAAIGYISYTATSGKKKKEHEEKTEESN